MIIALTGDLGSGKSTVAKLIAQRLGLNHYSSGDILRKVAKDKHVTIMELNKKMEGSDKLDKEIDNYVEKLGKTEDNFIIDSRLAWHFIKNSFKIYLQVDPKIAAQRVLRMDRPEEKAKSVAEMQKEIVARRASEEKRYQQYYGLSLTNKKNYDLVIDTSNIPAKKVAEEIIDKVTRVRIKLLTKKANRGYFFCFCDGV